MGTAWAARGNVRTLSYYAILGVEGSGNRLREREKEKGHRLY